MRLRKAGSILSDFAKACVYTLCLAGLFAFVSKRYLCAPAEAVYVCMNGCDLNGNVDIFLIGIQLFLALIPVYYLFQTSLRLSAIYPYVYACAGGSRRRIWMIRLRKALQTAAAVTAAVITAAGLLCGFRGLDLPIFLFYLLQLLIWDQLLFLTTLLHFPAKYVWLSAVVWVCTLELSVGHGVLLPEAYRPGNAPWWGLIAVMTAVFLALAGVSAHFSKRFEFYKDTVSPNSKRGNGLS